MRIVRAIAVLAAATLVVLGLPAAAQASVSFTIYKYYNPSLAGQQVELYAEATTDCGTITDYTWRFGDGSVRSGADYDVFHTWQDEGTYNVSLRVTDSCGQSETDGYVQTVKKDNAPVAAFSTAVTDKTVYADPSGTTDDDGVTNGAATPVYYFEWHWGDGSTSYSYASSSGGLASHSYASASRYTITLYAYDTAYNQSVAVQHTVQVGPSPDEFIEDDDSAVSYRGSWQSVACTRAACSPNGTERYSTTKGNLARVAFTGTRIAWIATKGRKGGTAKVYLDGVFRTRVNLHRAAGVRDGVAVYISPVLDSGSHRLTVKLARNKRANIDAFRVTS